MTIRLRDGLPYVTASLLYDGCGISMENVVLDTGSTGTVFAADKVLSLGLRYEVQDGVHPVRGVGGGVEFVFTKRVESLPSESYGPTVSKSKSARWTMASRSTASWGWTF